MMKTIEVIMYVIVGVYCVIGCAWDIRQEWLRQKELRTPFPVSPISENEIGERPVGG